MTITSSKNSHLKHLRSLARRREREHSGQFFAEGEDLIRAAELAGRPAIEGFRLAGSGLGGDAFQDVEREVLLGASTLRSGTRVIGVYEQRWIEEPVGALCVYLHGVSDPGNVGTVLRGAQAFGVSCVALGSGCADPHSPKAVRASMGAIFDMPLARVTSVSSLPGERVALVAGAGQPLRSSGDDPLTLLIGAEREGLPMDVVEECDRVCHIPIHSESLNAAMAATIAMYEMTRQAPGLSSP
jgi:TrmH family RNA methyltransferase